MSYYKYMVSVYRSELPMLNRSLRSSSVERSSYLSSGLSNYSSDAASRRFARAATVGPCGAADTSYFGYMPFNRSLAVAEDRIRSRLASVQPVSTYRRAYRSTTPYGATSAFDYKVADYANRLDAEESTRSYSNQLRSDYYAQRASSPSYHYPNNYQSLFSTDLGPTSTSRYESRRAYDQDLDSYKLNSRDLYSYRHYRKSSQTLEDRNARAKSPILGRELDRYYKTERRSDYMGDVSSGGVRDFRHYNYRAVPYFGGSDYYAYVPKLIRTWNNEVYPWNVPTF